MERETAGTMGELRIVSLWWSVGYYSLLVTADFNLRTTREQDGGRYVQVVARALFHVSKKDGVLTCTDFLRLRAMAHGVV